MQIEKLPSSLEKLIKNIYFFTLVQDTFSDHSISFIQTQSKLNSLGNKFLFQNPNFIQKPKAIFLEK